MLVRLIMSLFLMNGSCLKMRRPFVEEIRPAFLSYQIPLGLGVTQASITSIEKVCQKQNGCNQFLNKQPEELRASEQELQQKLLAYLMVIVQTSKTWHGFVLKPLI